MYEYKVLEIIKVYDGDTCTLRLDCGFGVSVVQTIRLYGINAPELKGDSHDSGLKSRNFLMEKLKSADSITIKTIKDKTEKFGRLLGIIFIDEDFSKSVNESLIEEGLAVEYLL